MADADAGANADAAGYGYADEPNQTFDPNAAAPEQHAGDGYDAQQQASYDQQPNQEQQEQQGADAYAQQEQQQQQEEHQQEQQQQQQQEQHQGNGDAANGSDGSRPTQQLPTQGRPFRFDTTLIPGKLFLGGLDLQSTKETVMAYCSQW